MNLVKHIERIKWWKRFACLGLLCLALIITTTLLYWHEASKPSVLSAKEQQGLQPIRLMLNIIQRTQQHRALSTRLLQDDSVQQNAQRAKAEELEAAIVSYETYLKKYPNAEYREVFEKTVDYWHNLHQRVSQKKLTYTESYELHTALVDAELNYLQSLIDYHHLSVDPNVDQYLLVNASLIRLPDLIEIIGQIRGYGIGLLNKGNATADEQAQLKALMLTMQTKMNAIDSSLRKLETVKAKNYDDISQNYQSLKLQSQRLLEITQLELLEKKEFSYSIDNFYSIYTSAINSYYSHMHSVLDKLDVDLTDRISREKNSRDKVFLYILFFILILMFVWIRFARHLLQQLGGEPRDINEIIQAIARGDLDSDIETKYSQSVLANIKRMQNLLREGDRAKSEFIATASHELKTPLSAIGSALSLSVSGELGDLPEPAMTYLGVAQKNSLRLRELINDFLDADKLSVGKLELDMHVQPLMPIIEDAKLSMTTYAQKYGVHIIMGPRFEYLLVNVDARRLRQVLKNLLSNAAKFSSKGEEIVINTTVHFDKVRLEIIDHGCGISDELKDSLFQKYSLEKNNELPLVDGSGLGLIISKKLVEAMGGEIGFTSSAGVGSCFFVDLPLEEPNS